MKVRLGVVGADDSLQMIQSVVKEFTEIACIPIVYWREEELIDLLKPHVKQADMWLFSGQVPFAMAKEWGEIEAPMAYVPHIGASLYRTLLHLSHEEGLRVDDLSFDTFHPDEFSRFLDEAGIPGRPAYLKHYEGAIHAQELADYHEQLWRAGQTKGAVTCLRTAHLELLRRGVPVYRVLPTRTGVHSIISMLLRTYEMLHFKDTQIAVQMIELDSWKGLPKGTFSTDEIHNLEIKTTEKLLRYAKRLQGSLKAAGPGRYVIFTTRGQLREVTQNFTSIPAFEEVEEIKSNLVTCGIGIGKTAYEAEIHAGTALLHAKAYGTGAWMAFFDDKTIAGPLGTQEQLTYSSVSDQLQAISRQTSLSVITLSKLASILKKLGKMEISAHELAQHMKIMPRSARRILMGLETKGVAQVIGEENPHPRGRPRKLYRITL
ncbi:ArsR family transcriptional regulator [Brevibacillus sp. SYP-B805]|uniref:ArsR family transcriptional regulator n=1 Tax=Brevibacillus sp. SYP-B805 TaxID=1578199 RepID=UPI0013EDF0F0|nr:ArsR family transcriptional regulator [Brevibacillus sp. SYP-B805]NGQ96189.1 ArsR family transcriptional regulator [Brevibacillus sp. SYP-B805]